MSDIADQYLVITDLLLGAVYADERMEGSEDKTVRKLLCEILETEKLPAAIEGRIENFDPETFDVEEAAEEFASDPVIKRRRLLELVVAVVEADDETDLAEDAYLLALARALGMNEDEYKDLVLEYEVEDLKALAEQVVSIPPPIPED